MSGKKRVVLFVTGLLVVAVGGGSALLVVQNQAPGSTQIADYCATLKQVMEPPQAAAAPAERFARVAALTASLADQAPEGLKADASTYAKGVHVFVDELGKVGYEFAKLTPEQMGVLQTPEMTNAATAVMKSADKDCHLSTGAPAPSNAPDQGTPPPVPSDVGTIGAAATETATSEISGR